ncbi:hypothetical protein B0T22DRAFT_494587 [Podospora appendiculata]|uniref:DUF7932 domain-containing protein n=1 Tax=Podospora appendiculata TaxID=314037 RepID=A0AAE1C8P0_9PEZI|nr:hypothetical protein B0T22DRAFT_494587 [Podospora appendiculata]
MFSRTAYKTKNHYVPGGNGGRGGDGGSRPTHPLIFGGHDGPPGVSQVLVLGEDGSSVVYSSRYMLEVVEFVVRDENEDGINEPGEHLIISNIVVKNSGQMPSPKGANIKIMIRGTKWLEPVMTPLTMPSEIPPGHQTEVSGTLRALIKNESEPRTAGTLLNAQDAVSLRAYSNRLQREIPEFNGSMPVVYQYPLLMTTPKYLDCVAKGDTVRFSWTVANISKKAQGHASATRRQAGTHISDPEAMFDLQRAYPETPHDVTDMIGVLEPGESMPITVDFQVSQLVGEFTAGSMLVNLILSHPSGGAMRAVVSFDLRIQVSPSYRYNPSARFLLVTSAQSPNDFVLQVIKFIRLDLNLGVDVFNLSLSGSFKDPRTQQDVLANYAGKSIIILGNTMNYFQNGVREPYELLEAGHTFTLLKAGTNFLIVAPGNMRSLKGFAHLLSVPVPSPSTGPQKTPPGSVKDVVRELNSTSHSAVITLGVKKKMLQSLDKTIASTADSAQEQISETFPLRRFTVATCDTAAAVPNTSSTGKKAAVAEKTGSLAVVEGLGHDTKFVASLQPIPVEKPVLSEYNMAMITHTLPFKDQCGIFWNLAGRDTSSGVSSQVVYTGGPLQHISAVPAVDGERERLFSSIACEAISWSIKTQIASELAHFCAGSGSPHSNLLAQLPLLYQFVSAAPKALPSSLNSTQTFNSLLGVLGHLRGVTSPLSLGQKLGQTFGTGMGKRKSKVRSVVVGQVSDPLLKLYVIPKIVSKDTSAKVITKNKSPVDEVLDIETRTKKQLAQIKQAKPDLDRVARSHELACALLEQLTRTPDARFLDVVNASTAAKGEASGGGSHVVTVMSKEQYALLRRQQAERQVRLVDDIAFSYGRLKSMVRKVEGSGGAPLDGAVVQGVAGLSLSIGVC